ncbi:unnamed protein product, partial [Rotaria sordida]
LFNTTNFNNQHELITNNNYSSSDWQISIPFNTNNESMLASCYTNNHDINSYNCENCEYWICVKCQAKATSYSDLSVTVRDEHTHLPDKTDKEILEIRQNLKRKAIDESVPIDRIVEEAFHVINNQFRSNDLLINIPSIHTIKNTVRKQRRKTRPPLPRSIEQLPFLLSDVYCKTTQGERFLLYVGPLGGVRSLVFSAYNDMIYLSQQENWYSDEGRHSRLKKHVNALHPNIYVAIDLLRKEQSLASIARLRDYMGAPIPKRRKNKVTTDECLIKL